MYVRHRPRYVAQSVFDDLKRVLRSCGWLGSTGAQLAQPLGLIQGNPIEVIDAFPDQTQGQKIALNTLAIDKGIPGEMVEYQLGGGSPAFEQPYQFHMAFYANSDATAQALFQDLHDRYMGMTDSPFITLYNSASATPIEVVRMEVEEFAFNKSVDAVAPAEAHLHFARLVITDYLDETERVLT